MMNKADVEAGVERLFQSAGAYTRDQSITIGGGEGEAPAIFTVSAALITRVPANRVDGTTVLPNDELMRLRAAVLPEGTLLKPGDFFVDGSDGLQRNIITAHLDVTGVLWTCLVRRQF
jgi:hypothetical protein